MTPLHPGDQLDHYTIEETVARGGMATIFRGKDMTTGGSVAIKVPHPETECDPVLFDRFQRETQIGEQSDHPGIMKVFREARRSRPYLAAEWIEGTPLREILNAEPKLSVERALQLAGSICEALEHIHERGVVHRDLKPENVMVRADGSVTLIDFGLASQAGARRLTFGKFSRIMGTVDYISPEQVQGKRGDGRSDLYALGIILFEMLAGHTPWEGNNVFAVLKERTVHDPAPLRSLNRDVPAGVEAIVQKVLRKEPGRRYADAAAFRAALANPNGAPDSPASASNGDTARTRKSWWFSLAMIPVSIFMMLLYAASQQ